MAPTQKPVENGQSHTLEDRTTLLVTSVGMRTLGIGYSGLDQVDVEIHIRGTVIDPREKVGLEKVEPLVLI